MPHNFQSYIAEIEKTHSVIKPHIQNTPLLNSKDLDAKLGCKSFVRLKTFKLQDLLNYSERSPKFEGLPMSNLNKECWLTRLAIMLKALQWQLNVIKLMQQS